MHFQGMPSVLKTDLKIVFKNLWEDSPKLFLEGSLTVFTTPRNSFHASNLRDESCENEDVYNSIINDSKQQEVAKCIKEIMIL